MSGATAALQAALVAALHGDATLGPALSGVFDGPPPRAAFPYAAIGAAIESDWSHKTGRGREIRLVLSLWDDGATAARLHGLAAAAEGAIEAMTRDLDGWRLVSLAFLRARILRDAAGPWGATIEYRARLLEQ